MGLGSGRRCLVQTLCRRRGGGNHPDRQRFQAGTAGGPHDRRRREGPSSAVRISILPSPWPRPCRGSRSELARPISTSFATTARRRWTCSSDVTDQENSLAGQSARPCSSKGTVNLSAASDGGRSRRPDARPTGRQGAGEVFGEHRPCQGGVRRRETGVAPWCRPTPRGKKHDPQRRPRAMRS